jgi:hypothetical protein
MHEGGGRGTTGEVGSLLALEATPDPVLAGRWRAPH